MAISDPKVIIEDEEDCKDGESGNEMYDSDDSGEDPAYDILEETRLDLSKLSMKKSKSRITKEVESGSEEEFDSLEVKVPKLDKSDEKCFEQVEKIIQAGQLEKLKVDQCKVYLRKYGLRLTGKKDVLMERIKEHLEVIDGDGEKKYPVSSFVLNCKGDACTRDVVMFEQNVYEMYSIASRSATGPPCDTRVVVGRIVKESYGAAKQQHTFTIEVLWSRGEKPLPPLHPLLIKGRNLYRLKTMRQPWADENERKKVLLEKHSRGYVARCRRETRIQEKEIRKKVSDQRVRKKESSSIQGQQNPIQCSDFRQSNIQQQQQQQPHISTGILPNPFERQNSVPTTEQRGRFAIDGRQSNPITQFNESRRQNIQEQRQTNSSTYFHQSNTQFQRSPFAHRSSVATTTDCQPQFVAKNHHSTDAGFHYRRPLSSLNTSPPRMLRKLCRYYPQGRCHYGDSCKFLHE